MTKVIRVKIQTHTHTNGCNFKPEPEPVGFRVPIGFANGPTQFNLA
jgi:hypothetical protein